MTGAGSRRDWDVIVVGLGAFGSAVAYWASTRLGIRVLGLEQFEFGHPNGASADHSRIIRLSYHRPDYVRLAKRAYESWSIVEAEADVRIVTQTGGLDLWPADPAIPMADYTESLTAEDVPFALLDAAEIQARWPAWRLDDDVVGMFQPAGGIADPYRGNVAHRQLALDQGATLIEHARVDAIRDVGGAYEVDAGGTTYGAGRVIITADAWTNDLLAHFDRRLPLTVTQEQVTYLDAPEPAYFVPDRFPVWIWMDDPSFYGFPIYGEAGPKIAQDAGGRPVTPATRTFEPDPDIHARVRAFAATHLPAAGRLDIYTKTCLYTMTPERDFVLDRLPDAPGVVVGLGAAHGFKFASVVGRVLVELALDGTSPSSGELGSFRIDRPALLAADPPLRPLV
jgi:sarcosine oxidase